MTAAVTRRGPWSMPDATLVLPADAPREAWLRERRQGIGGSDASVIAGVNRWSSRYALWLDKTGRAPDLEGNARMDAGHRLEPVISRWFTDTTGITVRRQGLVRSKARPWQQVTLDGLTDCGGVLEMKTTSWRLADEWDNDQVADHAEVQIQHALAVTGRTHGHAAVLIDGWDLRVRKVERDQDLIDALTSMEDQFWHGNVLADREPDIDAPALDAIKQRYADADPAATAAASPGQWETLRDAYQAAAAAEKTAATRKAEAEARIRALIGDATHLSVLGDPVATCRPVTTRRIDGRRLRTEDPDTADRYTTTTTHRRLHIPKEN